MTAVLPVSQDRDSLLSSETIHTPTKPSYFGSDDHHQQGLLDPSMGRYCPVNYVPSPPSSTTSTASTTSSTLTSSSFSHSSAVQSPYASTTTSSISLATVSEAEDEGIVLPSYEGPSSDKNYIQPTTTNHVEELTTSSSHTNPFDTDQTYTYPSAADDSFATEEPDRHVDYLSHDWREEDIWASWRYVVSRRRMYSNAVRLENASWRTWAKSKYRLRTVSPEKLNW